VIRTVIVLVLLVGTTAAAGQGRLMFGEQVQPNPEYDGQFTFARVRYGPPTPVVNRSIPWSHDYPIGEQNFMHMLDRVTLLGPKTVQTSVVGLDDPELFRYPILYMAEPGYWDVTEEEAARFREYLLKGGFVIFDDFSEDRGGWLPFEQTFRRAIPDVRFYDLEASHPVFDAFFRINSIALPQLYDVGAPVLRAVFEDNDPSGRMMAMINFNTDISEYWEGGGVGFRPSWETSEAYKFGVNYVMYAMTH